ncbi:MAG: T9SS type A sorting domain-containing protein, partial [Flavobacteriales bacterium]|nr:T9SS type A sorting domain-containing protein [Flavobacteriales bacterium]
FVSVHENPEDEMAISIYTDNRTGTLQLQLLADRNFGGRNFAMEIIDATGRRVKSNVIQLYSNRQHSIPFGGFPFGIYYLRLNNGKSVFSDKFLWK